MKIYFSGDHHFQFKKSITESITDTLHGMKPPITQEGRREDEAEAKI